ncbi:MAG: sigma-54-dependent transcriptional regulator [Blastocatellales bacterium]
MSFEAVRNYATNNGAVITSDNELKVEQLIKSRLVGLSHWVAHASVAVATHAGHDNPIVLAGEPGTGKEFIARLIHECSSRRRGPFVSVTCWPVIEPSLETMLFGANGANASGQISPKKGLVEMAAGGTLYLDICSSFSDSLKDRVFRLIRHREFYRSKGDFIERADLRVILGSAPQPALNKDGEMTNSLLLNSASDKLAIPPLRERKMDIEPLSHRFLTEQCRQEGKEERELSQEAIHILRNYDWPGNVGELKRCLEFAVRQAKPPKIGSNTLPEHIINQRGFNGYSLPPSGINWQEEIRQFEKAIVCAALKKSGGVQRRAAKLLGLKVSTLNTIIKRYSIDVSSFHLPDHGYDNA